MGTPAPHANGATSLICADSIDLPTYQACLKDEGLENRILTYSAQEGIQTPEMSDEDALGAKQGTRRDVH